MRPIYCYFFILSFSVASCVSTGTYKALQVEKSKGDSLYNWAMGTLKASQEDNARLSRDKAALKDSVSDLDLQLSAVKQNNTVLHKQLDEISAISTAQAESIRKSIDNIGAKDFYLQQLRTALSRRDSMNLSVLLEIKAAMGSFSDSLVAIRVAKGVVSLTVADQLLWGDDSTNVTVTDRGKNVLVRLARVLRDQPDVGCRVEVYPDSSGLVSDSVRVPDSAMVSNFVMAANSGAVANSGMDSWELEVRRAASVVRTLQKQYHVTAARLVAAGHGEYGKGTRVVLVPPAGELSEVLEKK
jgi:chemotaxis protein MotB